MKPQDAIDAVNEFRASISEALKIALSSKVSGRALIMELDDLAFELRIAEFDKRQLRKARELTKSIVAANGIPIPQILKQ